MIIVFILQMKRLRHRVIHEWAQGLKADNWQVELYDLKVKLLPDN